MEKRVIIVFYLLETAGLLPARFFKDKVEEWDVRDCSVKLKIFDGKSSMIPLSVSNDMTISR